VFICAHIQGPTGYKGWQLLKNLYTIVHYYYSRKPHSGPGDPEDDEGTAAGVSGSPRTMEERTNAALDRSTIKNISKLIYERDSGKAYPPNNSNNNNNNASKSSPRRNYH
jgi:hypothetical protein